MFVAVSFDVATFVVTSIVDVAAVCEIGESVVLKPEAVTAATVGGRRVVEIAEGTA